MSIFKKRGPESPDELEKAGYPETAKFMRWMVEQSKHILLRDVEVLTDFARGDSVQGPCGNFFVEEREKLFLHLNLALKAGKEYGAPVRQMLPVALAALGLDLSKFERIRDAS